MRHILCIYLMKAPEGLRLKLFFTFIQLLTNMTLKLSRTNADYLTVAKRIMMAGLIGIAAVQAEGIQPLDTIYAAAKDFLVSRNPGQQQAQQIEAGPLDARLALTACEVPLEAFMPPGSSTYGNTTVGVRCPGAKPWSVYVPVKIKISTAVVIAARPLMRGAQLSEADLTIATLDAGSLPPDYLTDSRQAIGQQLKRPLSSGMAVAAGMLDTPRMVRRDERVTILAEEGGLEVRMAGQALEDGALGQPIKVRNLVSKRIVGGVIAAPGIVKVQM